MLELEKLTSLNVKLSEDLEEVELDIKTASIREFQASEGKIMNLFELLPSMVYISDLAPIPEKLSIREISRDETVSAQVICNLLRLGGINDFQDLESDHRELKPLLKDASEKITRQFQQFFSQEEIEFEIEKQSDELVFSINGGVSVSASPKERSDGFQWLLAFFAKFALTSDKKAIIFLLDEPAIHLHPKGQKDVLNLLEKIAGTYQVIYSTHSPFLINKNYPQRLRLIVKDPDKGSIINNKPYADSTTRCWEPLKSSLGISLSDMLSLGEKNLIVEGISDQIIISGISRSFADIDHNFIDLENVSVVPAMGATCEEALAKLAFAEQLESLSLLDNDTEGRRISKNLQKHKGLEFIMVDSLRKEAITIEDLIPLEKYVDAVNSVYSHFEEYKPYEAITNKAGVIQGVRNHLRQFDFEDIDKVAVAKEFINRLEITKENLSEYDPFNQLFTIINKMPKKKNIP